jgi:hypothetical protein
VRLELTTQKANPHLETKALLNNSENIVVEENDAWDDLLTGESLTLSQLQSPRIILIENYAISIFAAIKATFSHSIEQKEKTFAAVKAVFHQSNDFLSAIKAVFKHLSSRQKIHHPFLQHTLRVEDQKLYIQDICERFYITPEQFLDCWNVPLNAALFTSPHSTRITHPCIASEQTARVNLQRFIDQTTLQTFTDSRGQSFQAPHYIRKDEIIKDLLHLQRTLKFIALAPPDLALFLSKKCLLEAQFSLLEKFRDCGFLRSIFSSTFLETHRMEIDQQNHFFKWISKN